MTCTCGVMPGEELCSSVHCLSGGSLSVFCAKKWSKRQSLECVDLLSLQCVCENMHEK